MPTLRRIGVLTGGGDAPGLNAVIRAVDKRVPITGHLGYTTAMQAIEYGIDGLEHIWISPYQDICSLEMRLAPGASMSNRSFWTHTLKGWVPQRQGTRAA